MTDKARVIRKTLVLAVLAGVLAAPVLPARAQARTVTIRGGGWGHGIGMSQYGAYGRALKGATAAGILEHYYSGARVHTEVMPRRIRVGLAQYRDSFSFTSKPGSGDGRVAIKVARTEGSVAEGPAGTRWRVEPSPTGGIRLWRNGEEVQSGGAPVLGDPDHQLVVEYEGFGSIVDVEEKPYDYALGRLEFDSFPSDKCGAGYCLRLIAVLSMQKYLYGLGEVPSSWPAAALKAQAIAGRTYAYNKIVRTGQHREPCDCAVFDSTYDQAYVGDAKRTGSGEYWDEWKAAVDDTDEQIVVYKGDPIQALYSSSSGGYTEHNENVWGGVAVPYLRGVRDRADAVDANPNHTWEVEMRFSDFEAKLDAAYGIGDLEAFELVGPFGVSGRVTVVKDDRRGGAFIDGSTKSVRVSGWSLRSALGLKDTLFRVDLGFTVAEQFRAKYDRLDGAPGDPVSGAYSVPRGVDDPLGRAQDFEVGRMTWNRSSGEVVWQWGRVLDAYDKMGREASGLGMPESDVRGPGEFYAARFVNGMIVWSEGTGTRVVRGDFALVYRRSGGPRGPMGVPVGGRETAESLPGGGKRQRFVTGTVYRNPADGGAYALWGRVWERYAELGEAASDCGYPTSSTQQTEDGLEAAFERGTIIWSEGGGIVVDCG